MDRVLWTGLVSPVIRDPGEKEGCFGSPTPAIAVAWHPLPPPLRLCEEGKKEAIFFTKTSPKARMRLG